jgi:hypothetical protein
MIKNPDYPMRIKTWRMKGTATFLALVFCLAFTGPTLAAGDEETATGEYSKGVKRCMTCHKEGKDLPAHEIFMTPMGISGDHQRRPRCSFR